MINECPHCEANIEEYLDTDLFDKVGDSNDFDDECPECEKEISVRVDWNPIFYVVKK